MAVPTFDNVKNLVGDRTGVAASEITLDSNLQDLGLESKDLAGILSDVEAFCDTVIILRLGEVVVSGPIRSLLHDDVIHTDIVVAQSSDELVAALEGADHKVARRPDVKAKERPCG